MSSNKQAKGATPERAAATTKKSDANATGKSAVPERAGGSAPKPSKEKDKRADKGK